MNTRSKNLLPVLPHSAGVHDQPESAFTIAGIRSLEGTAIGLTLGRLYFFKSTEQRKLGFIASFAVWIILAFNTIAMFIVGNDGDLPGPLRFYTRYVLPLSIVAVPYLWKWLLDLHPDSQERIATLEAESEYNTQWVIPQLRAKNHYLQWLEILRAPKLGLLYP